ncbi:flagellar transcriptional regulator FlhC [Bordetella sp. 15P40C-2]|uniref:flagellar transcriptional regulator FlhC n=1 Tax=Bordetella sp. 15P40C-2 TaxID=2572246 RepID=UPI0013252901|nr:flagellar transcriptional regulator FlhC [Bordetella sp. 15P40C-2]MVW70029.1 flagellar transcriptional regulator FlhC [Bordetella sp. 15P40C-2]
MAKQTTKSQKDGKPSAQKSVLQEGDDIALASTMIALGARLQVLEHETSLSYDRLSRLYREIHGCSPPKGMLPFSVDWFTSWRNNVHSSIFYSIYEYLVRHTPANGIMALIKAYRLYLEHEEAGHGDEPVLSFTRAWMLLRFFKSDMLQMTPCIHCATAFVTHTHILAQQFVCPVCKPPARIVGMLIKKEGAADMKVPRINVSDKSVSVAA